MYVCMYKYIYVCVCACVCVCVCVCVIKKRKFSKTFLLHSVLVCSFVYD